MVDKDANNELDSIPLVSEQVTNGENGELNIKALESTVGSNGAVADHEESETNNQTAVDNTENDTLDKDKLDAQPNHSEQQREADLLDAFSVKIQDELVNDKTSEPDENKDTASRKSMDGILNLSENNLDATKPEASEQELNPSLHNLMSACQQGDLTKVSELISNGEVKANDTFSDGITALHWAAINNRLTIVKYLIENDHSKADPNLLGGELKASPLHWACRNGLVYIVDYFIVHTDADPTLRDSQSYNALHLAVHSSNITLIIYLLLSCCGSTSTSKQLYVDESDNCDRTSLHWAAYQGDLLTINALLKFGADVSKIDKNLFIPLHWAFMKGYKTVLKVLAGAGSNIFAKNDQGKDSFEVAKDMNCYDTWIKVLKECGRNPKNHWEMKTIYLNPKIGKLVTFFTPYIILPIMFQVCSFYNGFVIPKLFFSVVLFAGSIYILQKLVIPTYLAEEKAIPKSPLLAGIFSGTAFWCIVTWAFNIIPTLLFKKFISNLVLSAFIYLFVWSFFKAMFINPGYVPVPSDNSVTLDQVKDLIKIGRFDTDNFCVNTFVRKPLRSKYSRFNKKLIARFDHYCPWVYNDIGVRNHKLFVVFVYSLNLAVLLFTHLSIKLFKNTEKMSGYDSDDESQKCWLLSDELCVGYKSHHFQFNLMLWCLIQYIWIAFLCLVQTFQILKGLTTWEFSSLNNRLQTHNGYNHSTLPKDFDLTSSNTNRYNSPKQSNGLSICLKLIGLDQVVLAIKLGIKSIFSHTSSVETYDPLNEFEIPTDYGFRTNWLDFWFIGDIEWRNIFYLPIEGENNLNRTVVDYYKLYEYPPKLADVDA